MKLDEVLQKVRSFGSVAANQRTTRARSGCLLAEHVVDAAAHDASRRPDEADKPFETVFEGLNAPLKFLRTVGHGCRPSMVCRRCP